MVHIQRNSGPFESSRRHLSDSARGPSSTPRREGTISPSTSEKEPSSEGPAKANSRSDARRKENTPPRTSPPAARSPPTGPTRERKRYKESTPVEKELPRSPFRPTQSGSTISSIRSASTLELEDFLRACEPSLVHITPILKSLGIKSREHLKAVARLTPTTRDREVKEDALRLGITVMEWAIFVDRIFTL